MPHKVISGYTPGPWEIVADHYITANSEYVAMVDESTVSETEMRANARLIAAAPDMLAALKEIYETQSYYRNEPKAVVLDLDLVKRLDNLIATVEGR